MLMPMVGELWDHFLFPLLVTMIKLGIEEKPTIIDKSDVLFQNSMIELD